MAISWTGLTHLSVSGLELILRALAVYAFILFLLRISGKRQLTQMSPTEFVALLLISNAVQNAMNAGDNSLAGGLILAGTLVFLSAMISWVTFRSRRLSAIIEGTPTLLVHQGKPIAANLKKELLTMSDLKILLRKQGVHSLSEVVSAVLESDGSLSIFRSTDRQEGLTEFEDC